MTEYSLEVLFDKFLDYLELYLKYREDLTRKINSVRLDTQEMSEEEFDFKFGDAQQEVQQYKDLARKALDSYIGGMFKSS